MEIDKVLFDESYITKTDKAFEELDINADRIINIDDLKAASDSDIKNEIAMILGVDADDDVDLDKNVADNKASGNLYYVNGKLANGVQVVNGEKINFKDGKPTAKVVKSVVKVTDENGKPVYESDGFFGRKQVTKTVETIYGDDGKLVNGEYNHKMYKDGKLLTGPLNGVYYVDGIQDDTFTGKGTDGLLYENGQPFTGSKQQTGYVYAEKYDSACKSYQKVVTSTYKYSLFYKNGALINGYDNGLYYEDGKLANGVKTVNGEKINFKDGKPTAKVVKSTVPVKDANGNSVYDWSGFGGKNQVTKTVETIYGADGKLVNGEYNHKMYKDGKLLTGPLDGVYYVDGIQDDTFSGLGTDGLMYENGRAYTGVKGDTYYRNGEKANGYYDTLYYEDGKLANGVKTVNGEKINFTAGKPTAKVVKSTVVEKNTNEQGVYTWSGLAGKNHVTKTVETVYGADGKLVNGEYNHKMYKDGKLLTGPRDGVYYVDGIQDDTFSGLGTDGLMYENGRAYTGVKGDTYYRNGEKANGYYDTLYYEDGKLANGVKVVNGEEINFSAGKPTAKVVKSTVTVRDANGQLVYESDGFLGRKQVTKTVETVYGSDGKLVNGEYNHKMYKDGKLLTGPRDGVYYVDGIQDDTFTGTGTDGLLYENGKPFTGFKTETEYIYEDVYDAKCESYSKQLKSTNTYNVYYKNGLKINGYA